MEQKTYQKDQDFDLIRITHYINPHNFWFKHESAYLFNAEEQNFQMEVNKFCEMTYGRGNINCGVYTPKQKGELVAVFYFQLSRWIRAEVDEIMQELNGQINCNLWAIDEGVPVKSSCQYIKPLPERFGCAETSVKHGGIELILPAESGYNYLEGRLVTSMIKEWCPGVVRVFETCIEEAVSIKFCNLRRHKVKEIDIYFGTMKITSHQNVTNNATDLLKKAGGEMVMLVDKAEFYDKISRLRTLDMKRFENNDRNENMKYHTNTFRPEYSTYSKPREKFRFRNNYIIEQAREKFLEWDMRNTASSVITTNDAMADSLQSRTSELPDESTNLASKIKGRRVPELEYSELVNESFSDDEEPPKVELQIPEQTKQLKPASVSENRTVIQSSARAYQRPENRTYDKSVSDLLPALNKIKLRRQPYDIKQTAMAESSFNSNKATVSAPSALNIVPAGFNLGNVEFSAGSVILGAEKTSNLSDRKAMLDHFHKDPKTTVTSRTKLRKHRKQQRGSDDLDSSVDEKIIRNITYTPVKSYNDTDDQW
ncbi:uncharacterized protein LOC131431946 [Malaya genurostris]|uniref:uncharacterized protein LOC131431946 n=1 Tax=Malaya genurostris TaxID=325434 RepID=UPI0026F3C0AD|nr:uncharacterized protein LOC131431946 [Malaya genurostris]